MTKKSKSMAAGNWLVPVSTAQNIQGSLLHAPAVPSVPSAPMPPTQAPQQMFPPGPTTQSGGLDPISAAISSMNTNPYLVGIFMLLLNLGGRFLSLELTKKQEAFLQSPWVRPLIFFTVIFIATRNLVAAFWVTLLFFFIIWVVANENSPFCMVPSWCGHNTEAESETYTQNVQKLSAHDPN
jgi:hypothetical protein